MSLDPRTPVLIGAGAVTQRQPDPLLAAEPLELMALALERAADDAGSGELLARADAIRVPRGFWDYPDPGRALADRFGAKRARTQVSEIGILQTTLFGHACRDIASGDADVVIVAGGEAKQRALRAQIAGIEASTTPQPGVTPDEVLRPHAEIMPRVEIERGLQTPVSQYAILESALRRATGQTLNGHLDEIARLWAGFSEVAVGNPGAWSRDPVDAATLRTAGERNRMLAFPYTKLHCSQWNVDQAAALIFCSAGTADALGIARDRRIFPLAVAESNHMVPLSSRAALHRSPGFAHAGRRALALAGRGIDDVAHLELYSCFPAAVRVQAAELGIHGTDRPLTVTGGMTFAGGPLNSFVLQALVRMVEVLRDDPGSTGMVNAISGLVTKQGVSLWSSEPPARFGFEDVSDAARADTAERPVDPEAAGSGTVAGYTVLYEGGEPARGIAVCDLDDGRRALATTRESTQARGLVREDFAGHRVHVGPGGELEV